MRWSALFALVFGLAVASLASAQTTTDRKVVYTYWEGSIDCKNGHKYVVEYTEGAGCHQILGEGYTTPVFYTMECGGQTVTSGGGATTTFWNETVSVQFFTDNKCTTAMAQETIYQQSSCLDVHGSYYQSQSWVCQEGKAKCMLCPNGTNSAAPGPAAAAALLFAAAAALIGLLV